MTGRRWSSGTGSFLSLSLPLCGSACCTPQNLRKSPVARNLPFRSARRQPPTSGCANSVGEGGAKASVIEDRCDRSCPVRRRKATCVVGIDPSHMYVDSTLGGVA